MPGGKWDYIREGVNQIHPESVDWDYAGKNRDYTFEGDFFGETSIFI